MGRSSVKSTSKQPRKAKFSAEQLIKRAQDLVDECQPDLALQFYEKALAQKPDEIGILDAMGELYMEVMNPDKAMQVLQRSIELRPNENPNKWLQYAQLVNGEDAEKYYEHGIKLLKVELELLEKEEANSVDAVIVKKQICDAFCSMAEIYMTDLCYSEDAEQRCEHFLQEAFQFDVGCPEPTQAMANLRLTQQRLEDGALMMQETYNRLAKCDENSLPPLEFRLFSGKLLIETGKFEEAADVLEAVMQEDDDNAELWYLVSKCYLELGDIETAVEFLQKCREMLLKIKKEAGEEFGLEAQLAEIESLIDTVSAKIKGENMDEC